jgi:catechol 2,3-dioxygenase
VADLDRSLDYYQRALGLRELDRGEGTATLGSDVPILYLVEQPGARPKARHSTGLYHFAMLVPSRLELARSLARLLRSGYPLGGHADHLVSEALYLTDPDGNGIEIYRDRPRAEWTVQGGQIQMATLPIDLQGLLREQENDKPSPPTVANGTKMGHVHLQTADVAKARRCYHDVLGFDIMASMPSALFVSAGGYHHHLGMNSWESAGGRAGAPDEAGLRQFTIVLPNPEALADVRARLESAGVPVSEETAGLVTHDQDGNRLVLSTP